MSIASSIFGLIKDIFNDLSKTASTALSLAEQYEAEEKSNIFLKKKAFGSNIAEKMAARKVLKDRGFESLRDIHEID